MARVYEAMLLAQKNGVETRKQVFNNPDLAETTTAPTRKPAPDSFTLKQPAKPKLQRPEQPEPRRQMQMPKTEPSAPRDFVPEKFRTEFRQLSAIVLRTAIQQNLKAVVVCGVAAEDSADFVTSNLSLALAENPALQIGRCRLVAPSLESCRTSSGESFRIKLQRTSIENLCEITPLEGPLSVTQLLEECDIDKLLEQLKARFDFVLIETDAVNWDEQVAVLAGSADGVILVAQKDTDKADNAMQEARQKLLSAGARILGAVLNRERAEQQLQRVA